VPKTKKSESQGGKVVQPIHNAGILKKKKAGGTRSKSWHCWEDPKLKEIHYTYLKQEEKPCTEECRTAQTVFLYFIYW